MFSGFNLYNSFNISYLSLKNKWKILFIGDEFPKIILCYTGLEEIKAKQMQNRTNQITPILQ